MRYYKPMKWKSIFKPNLKKQKSGKMPLILPYIMSGKRDSKLVQARVCLYWQSSPTPPLKRRGFEGSRLQPYPNIQRDSNGEAVAGIPLKIKHFLSPQPAIYLCYRSEYGKELKPLAMLFAIGLKFIFKPNLKKQKSGKMPLILPYILSGKRDSNPWPLAWEANALPTELLPRNVMQS